MITLFTGMPGAGKTAAMLDILMRELGDRPLFVHFDPAERMRPDQKLLHETLTLPHQPCHATTWHQDVPDGAVLVIDEAQGVWRPRGPAKAVPDAIAALETHRHSGVDIFVTTQAPRLIDANVRGLVGRHVHIRDTGFLGRQWYEWPETNEALSWKTCPFKRKYKLPAKVFEVYRSANEHHKPVREIPRLAIVAAVLVIAVLFLAWRVYVSVSSKMAPQPADPQTIGKPALAPLQPAPQTGPQLQASSTFSGNGLQRRLIDDRVDWIPRVSTRPESAPAYDHLRAVVAMPRVTGAMCVDDRCKCYTQQRTVAEISEDQCRSWAYNRPFDPYKPDAPPAAIAESPQAHAAPADPA